MYENPIKMYMSEMQEQIEKQTEEELMVSVNQSIGFDVNKEELIKALRYDREQYEKGYRDCKNDILDKVKQAREEINKLDTKTAIRDTPQGRESYFIVDQAEVLTILDKLIAESEVDNG